MDFFSPEILNFIEIGLIANFFMVIVTFVVSLLKAGFLNDNDLQSVIAFSRLRQHYIGKYNSDFKRYCVFLMNFVPMYSAVLNAWFLMNVLLIPGGKGIITATIKADQLALVQLVKYDIQRIPNK